MPVVALGAFLKVAFDGGRSLAAPRGAALGKSLAPSQLPEQEPFDASAGRQRQGHHAERGDMKARPAGRRQHRLELGRPENAGKLSDPTEEQRLEPSIAGEPES